MPLYTIKGAMRATGEDYTVTSEFASEPKARKWAASVGVVVADVLLAPPGTKNVVRSLREETEQTANGDEPLRIQRQILQQAEQICFWVKLWSILAVILIILEIIHNVLAAMANARSG